MSEETVAVLVLNFRIPIALLSTSVVPNRLYLLVFIIIYFFYIGRLTILIVRHQKFPTTQILTIYKRYIGVGPRLL